MKGLLFCIFYFSGGRGKGTYLANVEKGRRDGRGGCVPSRVFCSSAAHSGQIGGGEVGMGNR